MRERGEPDDTWEVGDDPEVPPDADVLATAPPQSDHATLLRERRWRWTFGVVLCVFLALGAAGVFGVRTATTAAAGGLYELRVKYPSVTRGGLASPLDVEISRRDGALLDEPVRIAVSSDYIAMFDANQLSPAPSSETSRADELIWEFDPPPAGEVLQVRFDARIEPAVQWGRDGFVRVLDDDGAPVAEVTFHTWVTP